MIESIANTACLSIVIVACVCHYNGMHRGTPECERWGFLLVGTGSFGGALSIWWPVWNDFYPEVMQNLGMCLLALGMMRGKLHALIARIRGWDGNERRSRA